jgi:hypothetical protein
MALPVIPNTFRVTLNWGGGAVVAKSHNVIHVLTATGTEAQIASALTTAFLAQPATVSMMESSIKLVDMSILKLDGSSGTQTLPPTSTVDVSTGTGGVVPEAAIGVTFYTGLAGPRHRGRIFLGPLTEDNFADGNYVPTLSTVTTAWNAWIVALKAALPGGVGGLGIASYKHADMNAVTTCLAHQPLRTQVRRLRRLR